MKPFSPIGTVDHDSNSSTQCVTCGAGYSVPSPKSFGPWCVVRLSHPGLTLIICLSSFFLCNFRLYSNFLSFIACDLLFLIPFYPFCLRSLFLFVLLPSFCFLSSNFACPQGRVGNDPESKAACTQCPVGTAVTRVATSGACSLFACPVGTSDVDSNSTTTCATCPAGTRALTFEPITWNNNLKGEKEKN